MASSTSYLFTRVLFLCVAMGLLSLGHARISFSAFNYLSIQGPNSTVGYNTVLCGQPSTPQPNQFGQVFCTDMPLLIAQDLNSKLIGRVQGTFAFVQQAGGIVHVSETFRINNTYPVGEFSGLGLEHLRQVSSKPIVGGIGAYKSLTGTATTTPLLFGNDTNGNFFVWFEYKFEFNDD